MRTKKINRFLVTVILTLLALYLFYKNPFLTEPLQKAFNVVFLPVVLSVFAYYLLRPLVAFLHARKAAKWLSILIVYAVITLLVVAFAILVWPTLETQMFALAERLPQLMQDLQKQLNGLMRSRFVQRIDLGQPDLTGKIAEYSTQLLTRASDYVNQIFTFVSGFVIVISTVPIIVYYALKDDRLLARKLLERTPAKYKSLLKDTMEEIDKAWSGFFVGRVILSLLVGSMALIGLLIVGVPYSLVLAFVIAVTNMIPYIGQLLGMIPALIVAFIDSPVKAVWVVVVILLAQQIEGNVLSPQLYGRRLDIHPITTILLILLSGAIGGIVGIMVVIPIYIFVKIAAVKLFEFYRSP